MLTVSRSDKTVEPTLTNLGVLIYPGEDRYPRIVRFDDLRNGVESGNLGADTHLLWQVHHSDLGNSEHFSLFTIPLLIALKTCLE